jgi:hypothetical protein
MVLEPVGRCGSGRGGEGGRRGEGRPCGLSPCWLQACVRLPDTLKTGLPRPAALAFAFATSFSIKNVHSRPPPVIQLTHVGRLSSHWRQRLSSAKDLHTFHSYLDVTSLAVGTAGSGFSVWFARHSKSSNESDSPPQLSTSTKQSWRLSQQHPPRRHWLN